MKTPEDHRPKKQAPALYSFDANGRTWTLPPGEDAVPLIPGKLLRDAYMDGEAGQMRLGFAMLEHVEAEPGAVEALYGLPAPEMLDHLAKWMEVRSTDDAATVPESLSSSVSPNGTEEPSSTTGELGSRSA